MALETELQIRGFVLSPLEERRIERSLSRLERRLKGDDNSPILQLVLDWHEEQRRAKVSLRLSRTNLGEMFVSHVSGDTADQAVRQATEDIERQIDKRIATLRGEATYGVPSRRRVRDAQHGPPLDAGDPANVGHELLDDTVDDDDAYDDIEDAGDEEPEAGDRRGV